jgi:hypothetical protein
MAKQRKPKYSKYDQWVEAGRPYWAGVSLANAVPGMPHLKRTLNARDTPYNRSKLDSFLRLHLGMVPAEPITPQEVQEVQQQEQQAPPAKVRRSTKGAAKGTAPAVPVDNKVSKLTPSEPPVLSDSSLKLPTFADLPEVLQRARIENIQRRREARMLHERLCDGIADDNERAQVCARIVELMDCVWASYDVERQWMLHGTLPAMPEDIADELRAMDLYRLKTYIVNQAAPRVSRWKAQVKLRTGDALAEAQMKLAEAITIRNLAESILDEKKKELDAQLAKLEAEREARRKERRAKPTIVRTKKTADR